MTASNPAPLTFEEWNVETAVLCEEWTAATEAAASRHQGVDTLEEVVALMDELIPLAEEASAEYRSVGVPSESADEVRRANEMAEEQLVTMNNLLRTARGGNLPGSQQHLATMNTQSEELAAHYRSLGIECSRVVEVR